MEFSIEMKNASFMEKKLFLILLRFLRIILSLFEKSLVFKGKIIFKPQTNRYLNLKLLKGTSSRIFVN